MLKVCYLLLSIATTTYQQAHPDSLSQTKKMKKWTVSSSSKRENKKNKERKTMNADGLHGGHGVLTGQMARELQMKEDEVREDKVVEEEVKKKDEEEEEKKEEAQEGVEAKKPSVIESPDQNVDGVINQDLHVRPQPPPEVGSYGVQILLGVESQRLVFSPSRRRWS